MTENFEIEMMEEDPVYDFENDVEDSVYSEDMDPYLLMLVEFWNQITLDNLRLATLWFLEQAHFNVSVQICFFHFFCL